MRRFTRLTNAFSKKVENHKAMIAVHYMHYNFARVHKTLRVTPAMEAGVADHAWSLAEIARLASSILYFGPQRKLRANDPFEIVRARFGRLSPFEPRFKFRDQQLHPVTIFLRALRKDVVAIARSKVPRRILSELRKIHHRDQRLSAA